VSPRNHVLDGDQDQTNAFAVTRGDKLAMRPFAELLCTLVYKFIQQPDLLTGWSTRVHCDKHDTDAVSER